MVINCPNCNRSLNIPNKYAGTKGKCNHCNNPIYVPRVNTFEKVSALKDVDWTSETNKEKNNLREIGCLTLFLVSTFLSTFVYLNNNSKEKEISKVTNTHNSIIVEQPNVKNTITRINNVHDTYKLENQKDAIDLAKKGIITEYKEHNLSPPVEGKLSDDSVCIVLLKDQFNSIIIGASIESVLLEFGRPWKIYHSTGLIKYTGGLYKDNDGNNIASFLCHIRYKNGKVYEKQWFEEIPSKLVKHTPPYTQISNKFRHTHPLIKNGITLEETIKTLGRKYKLDWEYSSKDLGHTVTYIWTIGSRYLSVSFINNKLYDNVYIDNLTNNTTIQSNTIKLEEPIVEERDNTSTFTNVPSDYKYYDNTNYIYDNNNNNYRYESQNQQRTVYITDTGKKYHRSGCQYLYNSSHSIDIFNLDNRYQPCSVCKP